ncbi:class I glutamine amidotransferase-like protein, partial [Violaceomyces palustris]
LSTLASLSLLALVSPFHALARQKILLYTYTQTFRHDSIPTAVEQIQKWGSTEWPYYDVFHTENLRLFDQKGFLNQFDALVFVSTSGRILNPKGEQNMIRYIRNGGGFMGVHEASDSVYHPWYGRLLGAFFNYHPEECKAELIVEDSDHPSVSFLTNGTWNVKDEMYNFLSDPRAYGRQLVLSANESSYHDPVETKAQRASEQGSPHPLAWWKEGSLMDPADHRVGGMTDDNSTSLRASGGDGRSFYTALGHSNETWMDETFQKHFLGGLFWVLNSTTIKSSSPEVESWRPGQNYTAREPF